MPALIVAMADWLVCHVAEVIACVVPLLKVAMACSCRLFPKAMDNAAGMMFSAVTTGGLTVTFAEPVMDPEVAVMVTAPVVMATTLPAALTLAIAAVDELQVAD